MSNTKYKNTKYKNTKKKVDKRKKGKSLMEKIHTFQMVLLVFGLGLAVWVVFFMPVGNGVGPTVNEGTTTVEDSKKKDFNLYSYFNKLTSARGKIVFDSEFSFENGDKLKVQSSHDFETKGMDSKIVGSTIYNMNEDALVMDDNIYVLEGQRYVKTASGYVKSEHTVLGGGNLNLGKIAEVLVKEDELVSEDKISCYKYHGAIAYGSMSNELRDFIRNQNVNIPDIKNVMLDVSLFVTSEGVPYKIVIGFTDTQCMIKSTRLAVRDCKVTGSLTITFQGYNGVERIDSPSNISAAQEGTYVFTDKLNKYLEQIGY